MGTTIDKMSFTADGLQFNLVLTVEGTTGVGQVEAISGTVGTESITGLSGAYYPDNQVLGTDGQLDDYGISFTISDGTPWNVYYLTDVGSGIPDRVFAGQQFPLSNFEFTDEALCFLLGTRILTPTGEVRVEALKRGDWLVTRFGGLQQIKWIGRHTYPGTAVGGRRDHVPVRLRRDSLEEGRPARDLYVSPGHSLLVNNTLALAKSLVNGITITQDDCPDRIDYFHIELEGHDCVIAEGTWAETYADWEDGRQRFHNAAEFDALFPDYRPPETPRLCAARPERGVELEAVLRPIVARAAHDVAPGPLAGFVDGVRGDWKLDGWAHDAWHPELPVLLEILLEGCVIGTVLACDYREDLHRAGYGQGRCSFTFISPVKLRSELLATLLVRRAVDGAPVPVSHSLLEPGRESAIKKPMLSLVA